MTYFLSDSTKFCRYCGASIPVDSEFCEKCGKVLTPEKESVKVSQPDVIPITPSKYRKLLLAVIVIVLALTSVLVLSFAPNPVIWKNRPWVGVEGISISVSFETAILFGVVENVTTVHSFLIIAIHNPTHRTPTIVLNHADLEVNISTSLNALPRTLGFGTVTYFQIFEGGNWANPVSSIQLTACSPTVVGLNFVSNAFPLSFNTNMTFYLNLVFTLNGVPTTFTDVWTPNLVSTPLQTTTTATTTTTGVYTPPNECLFPWV